MAVLYVIDGRLYNGSPGAQVPARGQHWGRASPRCHRAADIALLKTTIGVRWYSILVISLQCVAAAAVPIAPDHAGPSEQARVDGNGAVHRSDLRRRPAALLAVLSGVLLWAACPPLGIWPLAWVALAPLIAAVLCAPSARRAAGLGYLFAWVYLGAVWYWIGITIVAWTGSAIGWIAWFLLTSIFACFYALWAAVSWRLAQGRAPIVQCAALAAGWVVTEWARTLGSLTMPWAQLSYTQYRFLPLIQISDLTGAYGVSFLVLFLNAAIAAYWLRRAEHDRVDSIAAAVVLFLAALLYGGARMVIQVQGRDLRVAAVQDDFPLEDSSETAVADVRSIIRTTGELASLSQPPQLYVWSESAAPGDALNDPWINRSLSDLAVSAHAPILVGARVTNLATGAASNAALLFRPDGGQPGRYDKEQLVAFGEFIPFRRAIPAVIARAFQFFPTDVTPGTSLEPLRFFAPGVGPVALGPFICYESMYPQYARTMTRRGADLLVTQSDDAWYGSAAAMDQHLSAVVFRAIENRRDVVRATTNGVTCILDSAGRIVSRAPIRAPAHLVGDVRLLSGETLYTRLGDWFVAACGVGLALAAVAPLRQRRRSAAAGSTA